MRILSRLAFSTAALSLLAMSHANDSFSVAFDHLSAYQDTSNLFASGANYQVDFTHTGPDTLFIDGVSFSGDTADLSLPTTSLAYRNPSSPIDDPNNPSQFTYNFGDAISGNQDWRFNQVAFINGATSAAVGEHDFTMSFLGHYGADPTGVLMDLNCALVVLPKLDVSVTGSFTPSSIHAGQQAALSMTLKNNMQNNAFVTTTWFVSTTSNGSADLPFGGFDFGPDSTGWFNKTINPGDSLTRGHSFWTANGSTPTGTYTGLDGVVGGLFNGDQHYISMNPAPTIDVTGAPGVPGPAAATSMGLGWVLMFLRRRRNR